MHPFSALFFYTFLKKGNYDMDTIKIIVEGERACFTRPELKVERVSYDIPTPSALEGMLKSIYWKPAMRYVIDKIIVFNPIEFSNIRRNEVKTKINGRTVKSNLKKALKGDEDKKDLSIYTAKDRTQKATMFLTNVKYGIEFHIEHTGYKCEREFGEEYNKHEKIIKRRIKNGQCFRTPCLGVSEFPVRKIELVEDFDLNEVCFENKGIKDFNYMLYGLEFKDGGKPINGNWEEPKFSDIADAIYYRPQMIDGIVDVDKYRGETVC